jgi:nucleoside-diphosphate-sugar epimerase
MNHSSTILITGAGGFIGSSLVDYFSNKGWRVYALVHKINVSARTPLKRRGEVYSSYDTNIHYLKYDLEKGVSDESVYVDVDYIIHCAYVKSESNSNAFEINTKGSKRLLELSRKYDVKRNIFLSSMSADENASSIYGKQKYEIEKLFNAGQDTIVRPGLVIGNGGLLKSMIKFIKNRKLIPLVSGGKQPVQTIYIDDLILALDKIIEKNLQGTFTIASPDVITYKEFYNEVCKAFNLNAKFISIPYRLFYTVIAFAEALKIELAVSKDSLKGLKNLRVHEVEDSLKKIEMHPRSIEIALQCLANFKSIY